MYGTILKQQIPDIIALEIDLLLAKFYSYFFIFFFHSIIDMFVNAFCAISCFSPLSGKGFGELVSFEFSFVSALHAAR